MAEYKERLPQSEKIVVNNETIVDIGPENNGVIPREVRSWMEKVEGAVGTNPQDGITDDKTGQPLLYPSAPTSPVVQLPVSKNIFVRGFKKSVTEAGKWLSTFILRVIKMKKGNVSFKA
jgi:hypothetical protein